MKRMDSFTSQKSILILKLKYCVQLYGFTTIARSIHFVNKNSITNYLAILFLQDIKILQSHPLQSTTFLYTYVSKYNVTYIFIILSFFLNQKATSSVMKAGKRRVKRRKLFRFETRHSTGLPSMIPVLFQQRQKLPHMAYRVP